MNIQTVRNHLSQGETGKAIQATIDLLQSDPRYHKTLLRTVRNAESTYNVVKRKEWNNLVSSSKAQRQYARINNNLQEIVDLVAENGTLARYHSSNAYGFYTGGAATFILVAGWLLWPFDTGEKAALEAAKLKGTVPAYEEFIRAFPDKKYNAEARDSLNSVKEKAKDLVLTVDAYIAAKMGEDAKLALHELQTLDPYNSNIPYLSIKVNTFNNPDQ